MMNESRAAALCNILDEALVTFDDFEEDQHLNELCPSNNIPMAGDIFGSRKDTLWEDLALEEVPSTPISKTVSKHGNGEKQQHKKSKRASWKKPKDKPKRPLSAYNLFFQLERDNIVSGGCSNLSREEILARIKAKDNRQQPKTKRIHRKTHGKITFGNLARSIADKWKALDKDTREVFENAANQEKLKYKKELEEWNWKQKSEKDEQTTLPLPPVENIYGNMQTYQQKEMYLNNNIGQSPSFIAHEYNNCAQLNQPFCCGHRCGDFQWSWNNNPHCSSHAGCQCQYAYYSRLPMALNYLQQRAHHGEQSRSHLTFHVGNEPIEYKPTVSFHNDETTTMSPSFFSFGDDDDDDDMFSNSLQDDLAYFVKNT